MRCINCGAENNNGEKYCTYCGKKLSKYGASNEKKAKKGKKPLIIALSLLCIFVAVFFALFIIMHKELETNDGYGEIYCSPVDEKHLFVRDDSIIYADNEILIVAEEGTTRQQIENLGKKYHMTVIGCIEKSGDYQLKTDFDVTDAQLQKLVDDLNKEDPVYEASLNYVQVFFDNSQTESRDGIFYGEKWQGDLQNFNDAKGKSWGLEAINTIGAWDLLEQHSNEVNPVRAGVIDSGFDISHEDIKFEEVFYENGQNNGKSPDQDSMSHGTHVAGTIAAKNRDKTGICGIYPYGEGNLYAVNSSGNGVSSYLENGNYFCSIMVQKVAYAELIVRNVKVINQSQGFNWYANLEKVKGNILGVEYTDYKKVKEFFESTDFSKYVEEANLLGDFFNRMLKQGYDFVIVSAAGNDSDSSIGHLESRYASWNNMISQGKYPDVCNRIIVVGSVDPDLKISSFSNAGNRLDIYAPGRDIYSLTSNNKYGKKNGTSMAAPHVTSVAAMVWSANNNFTGAQVKTAVCRKGSLRCTSFKMVDAYTAVEYAIKQNTKPAVKANENSGILMSFVVKKDGNSEAISGAKILATNITSQQTYTETTDDEGHFEIVLPSGDYTLSVSASGYIEHSITSIHIDNQKVNYLEWIELDCIYYSGKYLVNIDNKIIAAKSDGIFYKENVTSEAKKISNTGNVISLLSDGKTVYYAACQNSFGETLDPRDIYVADVDKAQAKKLFSTNGSVDFITCMDHTLYYTESIDYGANKLMKYDLEANVATEIVYERSDDKSVGWIDSAYCMGKVIYFTENNSLCLYSITNDEYKKIISSSDGRICDTIGDKVYYFYSKNGKSYVSIISSDNTVETSVPIPSGFDLQIINNKGEYALFFNKEQSDTDTMFDLYKMDLRSGELSTSKNEAGRYKNKNYFVSRDLSKPENIYFMYNLGIYDESSNKIINKKHDEFEIDITKPMWIIDSYIVDWDLNTYKIYDDTVDSSNTNKTNLSQDESWKTLYINYINSMNEVYEDIYIAYIDDDNIPELYVRGKYHMAGAALCWIDDGEVKFQACAQNFGFKEKSGKCYAYTMQMGVSLLTEYILNDGELTEKKVASCSENDNTYTWEGDAVSKDDFWAKHQSFINNYTTPDYTEFTSREVFATTINSY